MSSEAELIKPVSFWRRRVLHPILDQLRLGITPAKISMTIALGLTVGIFPILGSTTLLCALIAYVFQLNQPIIQLVNYFAYPIQLGSLLLFYRAGQTLFGQPHLNLSIPFLLEKFRAGPLQFLKEFGIIGLQGIVVWCLLAPVLAGLLYWLLLPAVRVLARRVVKP